MIAYKRMVAAAKPKDARASSGRPGNAVSGGGPASAASVVAEAFEAPVIGERVKALREASGLSLRELAERSGVSAPMLSQVERGETSPTITVAARIAAGLDLRLSQLLRLDEGGTCHDRAPAPAQPRRKRAAPAHLRGADGFPAGPAGRALRHTLAPGGSTGAEDDPPMHEPGSREIALVESGRSCWSATGSATTSTPATA